MCGIAGIVHFNKRVEKHLLKRMTDIISHRGPDAEGQWYNESGNVALGHRRLSILDLSKNGDQPMHYLNGRYTITFNGEIYNYIELKEKLVKKGYSFRTKTDTEVLIALYDLEKENCLNYLDGMFSFVIWDEREKKLFGARDRFGEKPFFYLRNQESFYFASEVKSIFSAGIERELNAGMIYYYLAFTRMENTIDRSETFFKNIKRLESGHYFILDIAGNFSIKKYWDLSIESNYDISGEQAAKTFYELLEKSIKLRLRSDVPVGSSLSGGVDSSAVVLILNKIKDISIHQKTFSARFKDFDKDEGYFIQQVIDKADISPYFTWPDGEKLSDEFDKLFYHQEEPFNSSSIFAEWETMKLAYENDTKVLLDGHGADEMLAGYNYYYSIYYKQLLKKNPLRYFKEVKEYKKNKGKQWSFSFKDIISAYVPDLLYHVGNIRRNMMGNKLNSLSYLHRDFLNNYTHLPNPYIVHTTLKESLKFSLENVVLQEQLRYTDRSSMAFSREVRLPFLDHNLVQFTLHLPDNFIIHNGWTKYIMRRSLQNILPYEITWRKDKIGYEPPENRWLQNSRMKERIAESRKFLVKEKIYKSFDQGPSWEALMIAKLIQG